MSGGHLMKAKIVTIKAKKQKASKYKTVSRIYGEFYGTLEITIKSNKTEGVFLEARVGIEFVPPTQTTESRNLDQYRI
jgi:hypothetical protein